MGGNWHFVSEIYALLTINQAMGFMGTKRDADNMHQTLTKERGSCVRCYMVKWNMKIVMLPWKHCEMERVILYFHEMERVIYLLPPMSWREVFTVIMCVWLSTMVYGDNVCLVINYGIPVDRDG